MNTVSQLKAMMQVMQSGAASQVLATVVKVEGSAYRRPGARMMIAEQGVRIGTISGGCLESDVAKKAWWLTASGKPSIQRYSTATDDEDLEEIEQTFGLGCNGTVHVLLERVQDDAPYLPFELLREVVASGRPAVLATVIGINGHAEANIAERMALDCEGQLRIESVALGTLVQLHRDLDHVLEQRRTAVHGYPHNGGEIEVLIEFIAPPRRLVIFGAGHDATPLMLMAKMQGWQVTIIDSRSHFARPERFPEADQVLAVAINPDAIDVDAIDLPALTDGAAVAIMTHSFSQDLFWLHRVLSSPAAYIGQLGPRNRTERLLAHLQETTPSLPGLARLHYPMGLDIGGDGPESVALAVLAEMTAVLNQRSGQMLKWRERPIHDSELRITASS